jgi:PAS domain-containing protein
VPRSNPNISETVSTPLPNDEELKSELRKLRQWKLRMEGAMQSAAQILREWDTAVDETLYSGAMERILGIFPHEIAGQFEIWMLLIHPDDRMAYRREIERVLAEGGPFEAGIQSAKKERYLHNSSRARLLHIACRRQQPRALLGDHGCSGFA